MRHLFSKPRLALILTGLGLVGLLAFWQTGRANPIPPSVVVPSSVGFGGFGGSVAASSTALSRGPRPVAFGGFGGAVEEDTPPEARQVYVQTPVSAKAAAIWFNLQKPVSMPFADETPLEDVIKYIRSATVSDELPQGIPIYIDPAGLQEADKTMLSPITLNLEGLPLALTLRLALKQLDLVYQVLPEGLLYITYIHSHDHNAVDPLPTLLNEVRTLREDLLRANQPSLENELKTLRGEVQSLRDEVQSLRKELSSPEKTNPPDK
jgi:hypothetical protein